MTTEGLVRSQTLAARLMDRAPRPDGDRQWRMASIEFWPDYGNGPLWMDDGKPVDLSALPLEDDLRRGLEEWQRSYSEERVPVDGPGDPEWLREGTLLLERVRLALAPDHEVVVTEPWWGD